MVVKKQVKLNLKYERKANKMDLTAFFKLTYGLYVVSTYNNGRNAGCIVNTVTQVTAQPPRLAVAVNKQNTTAKWMIESGCFAATALTQTADMELIGKFGFQSSAEVEKFAGFETGRDALGLPYLKEHAAAHFSCKIVDKIDLGTHWLFIGEVVEAEKLLEEEPLTYSYYHRVLKGGTPKTAPSYKGEEISQESAPAQVKRWRCSVCGYVYEGEQLPGDFTCPWCGQGADKFVPA